MPQVSVIVPVYKVEPYLRRCVDSILAQTFTDFELILVDDGSPDSCPTICDEYAEKDHRVRVIHKENGGVSSARNAGLNEALGEYILFIDSDDYVDIHYVHNLILHQSDLTICGIETRNEYGVALHSTHYTAERFDKRSKIDFASLYQKNMLYSPCCKLFRSDIIRDNRITFPSNVKWGEDGMFVSDYLCHINSICVTDYVGYYYIKYDHAATLSTSVREDIIDMVVLSREYCINRMLDISADCYESVRNIIVKGIKSNCAYFIYRLLDDSKIEKKEKIQLLSQFMKSQYVCDVIDNPKTYYPQNFLMSFCLKKKEASSIVSAYCAYNKIWKFIIKQSAAMKKCMAHCKSKCDRKL